MTTKVLTRPPGKNPFTFSWAIDLARLLITATILAFSSPLTDRPSLKLKCKAEPKTLNYLKHPTGKTFKLASNVFSIWSRVPDIVWSKRKQIIANSVSRTSITRFTRFGRITRITRSTKITRSVKIQNSNSLLFLVIPAVTCVWGVRKKLKITQSKDLISLDAILRPSSTHFGRPRAG